MSDPEEEEALDCCGKVAETISLFAEQPADELLVDSGVARHVCPYDWHPEIPVIVTQQSANMELRTADGTQLEVRGEKTVPMTVLGIPGVAAARFFVTGVKRPIVSVPQLNNAGHDI